MLIVLFLLAVGLFITLGIGSVASAWVGNRDVGIETKTRHGDLCLGDVGVFGLIMLTLVGTALNFAVALSSSVTAFVAIAGIVFFILHVRRLKAAIAVGCGFIPGGMIFLFLVCFISIRTYHSTSQYDTGLYHLQTILEIIQSPVILGEANIHIRFGYNSLWFLCSAILAFPGFGLRTAFLANPLLMIFVMMATVQRVCHAWSTTGFGRTAVFGTIALLIFTSPDYVMQAFLGSPNTDVPSNVLVIYVITLALFLSDAGPRSPNAAAAVPVTVILLPIASVFALTTKLSVLPLILVLANLVRPWRRALVLTQFGLRGVMLLVGMVVLWVARGIATSGCPALPSSIGCLPVPWLIDPAKALDDLAWMRAWARRPGERPGIVLADWAWFPDWAAALVQSSFFDLCLELAVITGFCLVLRLACPRSGSIWSGLQASQKADSLVIVAVAVIGFVFWFSTAPLVRYGKSWIVLPLALLCAHAAPRLGGGSAPLRGLALWLPERWSAGDRWVAGMTDGTTRVRATIASGAFLVMTLLLQRPNHLLGRDFPRLEAPAYVTRTTRTGLRINVPVSGDQCWGAPSPCTPTFSERLETRSFGPWRMMLDPR